MNSYNSINVLYLFSKSIPSIIVVSFENKNTVHMWGTRVMLERCGIPFLSKQVGLSSLPQHAMFL